MPAATNTSWINRLRSDPVPWLLETDTPAVRHLTLRWLLDRPEDDLDVVSARRDAMAASPIAAIMASQHPTGYWEKPGAGYATKYRGTVWQLIFLDQLGADAADRRVRAACEYVWFIARPQVAVLVPPVASTSGRHPRPEPFIA